MSISLFTKIRSNIPIQKKNSVDKGIYSDVGYSGHIYGVYERIDYIVNYTQEINIFTFVENKNIDSNFSLYTNIFKYNNNELLLFTNILESNYNSLNLHSNISKQYYVDLTLYTHLNEKIKNDLDLYSFISLYDNSLSLYTNVNEDKHPEVLLLHSNISAVKDSNLNLFTNIKTSDFKIKVFDKDTNLLLSDLNWVLYKRDNTISVFGDIDVGHIVVDSGITHTGIVDIFLEKYNLLNQDEDYFIKVWKLNNINHELNVQIQYFYEKYINTRKQPYLLLTTYLKREGSQAPQKKEIIQSFGGGGMTPREISVYSKLVNINISKTVCNLKENITISSKFISFKEKNIVIETKLNEVIHVE